MNTTSRAVLAALSALALNTSAHAAAWAQLDVTGALSFSQSLHTSGSSFQAFALPYTVRRGEPVTLTLNYNFNMSDSGLPVTLSGADLASYNACHTVLTFTSCPPAITPYESAYADLSLFIPFAHESVPPFVEFRYSGFQGGGAFGTQRGPEADALSQSGTWTIQVIMQDWGPISEYTGTFAVVSDQWVVTSPIPEPATYPLMLGLGGWGLYGCGADRGRGPHSFPDLPQGGVYLARVFLGWIFQAAHWE
jgi:hypothetical protein